MEQDGFIGLDQFKQNLDKLSDYVAQKVLMEAVSKAAVPVRDQAERNAPILQEPDKRRVAGVLKKEETFRLFDSSKNEVTARIGPSKLAAHGRFSEGGTFNQAAHPWLRPALDEKKGDSVRILGEELWKGIQKRL